MNTDSTDNHEIQAAIDRLKLQHPNTKELYREVCVLLFFRYGITPTANKLYQYVRKGSMSAPVEALNLFWKELRARSKVRIENPDLPEELKEAVGQFAITLWTQAQEAAQANLISQLDAANEKVTIAEQETELARNNLQKIEAELAGVRNELENAKTSLHESQKNNMANTSALADLEKSFKSLQNERDQLERTLEQANERFSMDLDKISGLLEKSDERYRALEAKLLLEVDRERQKTVQLQKDLKIAKDDLRVEQGRHQKSIAAITKSMSVLHEKLGESQGQRTQLSAQLKQATKKLLALEKKASKGKS